jgi:ATP-dependent DNA ligase
MTYLPMLASPPPSNLDLSDIAFSDEWALELKVDGDRAAAKITGDKIAGIARSGRRMNLPRQVIDQCKRIGHTLILDGELLGDVWVVFDMPLFEGVINETSPWFDRRAALGGLFQKWNPDPRYVRLMPAEFDIGGKADMIERVTNGRGEGLMAKQVESLYRPRAREDERCPEWIKLKKYHTVDCVVTWVGTPTTTGKWNMGLAVFRGGELVDVGEVGRLTGDGRKAQRGDVVEVRVLYVTDDNRLYQPTLPRLRGDKNPFECTWDQLAAAGTDRELVLSW